MLCPEGYFTPKMLEKAFYASLSREQVCAVIFETAGQKASEIPGAHKEEVLRLAAAIFLHRYVCLSSDMLRICNVNSGRIYRADPWLVALAFNHPVSLPLTWTCVEKVTEVVASAFPALDQELWVIDCRKIEIVAQTDTSHQRAAALIRDFDGWSLCFPDSAYPKDVGTTMNELAKQMTLERSTISRAEPPKGRPGKIEQVAACIKSKWPQGWEAMHRGAMRTEIEQELGTNVSPATLSNAIKTLRSA